MPASEININKVLKALGGSLFDKEFCGSHSGSMKFCTNSVDCSSRSLWQMIQLIVDRFLDQVTLQDLVGQEKNASEFFDRILHQNQIV
jgi:DNA-binding IscR family transcriptional regulator